MYKFERYRQIGLADFNQPHLQYIRRDRKYLDEFLEKECELTPKQAARLAVIDQVYEQQKYMYDNRVHSVPDRIVSISQPYIRPIVRGKTAAPVELFYRGNFERGLPMQTS